MKRLLITLLTMNLLAQNMFAETRYNPINNLIYSHPETSDINQFEYRLLILACIGIENRMIAINGKNRPSVKDFFKQCELYLKRIGSPTALRLIADMKHNKICYADGSFMKKIYE